MISSELTEILGMSDRIAVMHGGTIVGTLDRARATQEAVLELALGHVKASAPAIPTVIEHSLEGRAKSGAPT
jgi:ribose transport system ATP-binding protein